MKVDSIQAKKPGTHLTAGLIWLAGTLLAYTIVMRLMGSYEIPSYICHTLLLAFPLGLILVNRANIQRLGLVKGKYQFGLLVIILGILALVIYWHQFGLTLPTLSATLAFIVVYAPITEELFFRGYLQPGFEGRYGEWVGLVITAALFTIAHLPKVLLTTLAAPDNLLPFFILGIVLGYIRDKGKSVCYSMLCHAGYSFATMLA